MPVAFCLFLPIAIPSAWAIPGRPDYYILHFQDLVESTTIVRQKEKGETGSPRGEELPCRFLSHLMTLSWSGHILATPDREFNPMKCWGPIMDRNLVVRSRR